MRWQRVSKIAACCDDFDSDDQMKDALAEEAGGRCVYCAIAESLFGGRRNYHIEHFRPKARFEELSRTYANLFFSCGICNSFKGSDWPAEPLPDLSVAAYIDPSEHDLNEVFFVDEASLAVSASTAAARYVEARLYLNRPQLIRARRRTRLAERIRETLTRVRDLDLAALSAEDRELFLKKALELAMAGAEVGKATPYLSEETKRPGSN